MHHYHGISSAPSFSEVSEPFQHGLPCMEALASLYEHEGSVAKAAKIMAL